MRPIEREVTGLKCSEVMEQLSAYLEGDLPPGRVAQIESHVAQCQACATFGDGFARLVDGVRTRLGKAEPLPVDVEARLRASLNA